MPRMHSYYRLRIKKIKKDFIAIFYLNSKTPLGWPSGKSVRLAVGKLWGSIGCAIQKALKWYWLFPRYTLNSKKIST